jgi:hypothetical protein
MGWHRLTWSKTSQLPPRFPYPAASIHQSKVDRVNHPQDKSTNIIIIQQQRLKKGLFTGTINQGAQAPEKYERTFLAL